MSQEVSALETLRVLLVDDDSVDRMAVRRAVAAMGLKVELTEAKDADAALRELRTRPPDCVLLDYQMPGRDGGWVLKTARAEGVSVPVIMLTGQGDELTAVNLMKAGASDYVPKSTLSAERLEQSIRHCLRVYRVEKEAARAARLLVESQERLQLALAATGQGTWDLNLETQELKLDARCRELYGYGPDELVTPDTARARIALKDREAHRLRMEAAQNPTSGGRYEFEFAVAGSGASRPRWVRVMGKVIFHQGVATRIVGTSLDITMERDAAEATKRRLEFEQQLLGIVSHDLRNPVSAMMMNASVLLRREETSPLMMKTLARIVSSGERATRMIRDLLDFTQARVGGGIPIARKPMDLHEVAAQTVEEVRASFGSREIVLESQGDGRGSWDADRLAQILTNLVVNAVSYSPPDSVVTVRTASDHLGTSIEVHNWGPPIPADKLAVLFEPFTRGTNSGQSLQRSIGLGLYIVQQVVKAHEGRVEVDSSAEAGTTFRIHLPRVGQVEAA